MKEANIGIYWDFENLHAAVLEERHGQGYYSSPDSRFRLQEPVVNIGAIVNYASAIGNVTINRAYGNWQWFSRYRLDLLEHSLDLVQMFPPGGQAKNGADIRMALDILDDLHRHPELTHVIVVGGDSDYISLAQKIRSLNRTVIGIGEQSSVNKFWTRACNEFKFYHVLLGKMGFESAQLLDELRDPNMESAQALLLRAVKQLGNRLPDDKIELTALRPMVLRLEPTFDEVNYGYTSFTTLLEQCSSLFHVDEPYITLTTAGEERLLELSRSSVKQSERGSDTPEAASETYEKVFTQGGIRLPSVAQRSKIVRALAQVIHDTNDSRVPSFKDLEVLAADKLGLEENNGDINAVRHMLYRLRLFKLFKENGEDAGVSLPDLMQPDAYVAQAEDALVKYLARYADHPLNINAMYEVLYGDEDAYRDQRMARIRELTK